MATLKQPNEQNVTDSRTHTMTRKPHSFFEMLFSMVLLMGAVVVIGVGALIVVGLRVRAEVPPPAAPVRVVVGQPNPSGGRIIVTVAPLPSLTPRPTNTPRPSSTPGPTFTPRAVAAVPTEAPAPDVSVVMPDLNNMLVGQTAELTRLGDRISELLKNPDKFSSSTMEDVAEVVARVQQLRNDVSLTSLNDVPMDLRIDVVAPAYRAFVTYANSLLQWTDGQSRAFQLYADLEITETKNLPKARAAWESQRDNAAQLREAVTLRREKLEKALVAFSTASAIEVMKVERTGQAILVSSLTDRMVSLKPGKYEIWYVVKPEGSDALSAWLASTNTTTETFKIIENGEQSAVKVTKGSVIEITGGSYRIAMPDTAAWWVIALEPLN